MAGSRRITVEFLGRDTSAGKTAKAVGGKLRGVGKDAEASSKSFGRASSGMKRVVGTIAGLAIGTKVVGFLKDSVGEAREAQKVSALTTSVIKATGGAAKITAAEVGKLAEGLSKKTGIDDEVIQSGQNMLLTFKNIRNEVGVGNDIFNQSSRALVDMASAMGTEPKQAAIQLGKALNDPVKGVSALSRVGVTFTDKQKKVIARLVETGDVAGAQKVILKELNSEFGGAAAAQATAADKAKVAWGNLKEQIGSQLLPVVDKAATWFSDKVAPAVSKFVDQMKSGEGAGGRFKGVIDGIGKVIRPIGDWIGKQFVPFIKDLVGRFHDAMGGTQGFKDALKDLQPAIDIVKRILGVLWEGFKWAAKIIIPLLAKQIRVVAFFVGKLGEAAKWLWNKAFQPAIKFIVKGFGWILTGIGKMLRALGHIPGFGWATKAANKMEAAGKKAREMAEGIDDIPDKVTPNVKMPGAAKAISNLKTIKTLIYDIANKKPSKNSVAGATTLGGLLGGNRATGGSVHAGRAYTVGESGRETFIPTGNGRIVPNRRTGGGGVTNIVHIHGVTDSKAAGREIRKVLLDLKRSNGGAALGIA